VLCRADYGKGVYIPLAPLPSLPIKKERSDSSIKSEGPNSLPNQTLVLTVTRKPVQEEGLVIDSDVVEWTPADDKRLKELASKYSKDWIKVARALNKQFFKDQEVRSALECAERWAALATKKPVREIPKRWSNSEVAKMLELWLSYDGKWEVISSSLSRSARACQNKFKKIISDTRKNSGLQSSPADEVVRHAQAFYSSH
jgi:hypothetical protein